MAFEWKKNKLCSIEGSNAGFFCRWPTLAVERRPPNRKILVWFDTDRDRRRDIARVIKDTESVYEFIDSNGHKYSIKPMTLAYYKSKVESQLLKPLPKIDTQKDMEHYYLRVLP